MPKEENVRNVLSLIINMMKMKEKVEMSAKYSQGRVGEGVGSLKPFSVSNITLKAVVPHSNGYSSERDFKWYVEDKKWRPRLKFMANQSLVPPKNKNCIVNVVRGPFGVS